MIKLMHNTPIETYVKNCGDQSHIFHIVSYKNICHLNFKMKVNSEACPNVMMGIPMYLVTL